MSVDTYNYIYIEYEALSYFINKNYDFRSSDIYYSLLLIIMIPIIKSIIARMEYYYQPLQSVLDNKYITAYLMTSFFLQIEIFRFYYLFVTILSQARTLDTNLILPGVVLFIIGQIISWVAFFRHGLLGSYMGEYCGIVINKPVSGFPFDILRNPMYFGTSLGYMGLALSTSSVVGVTLSFLIYWMYSTSIIYENQFEINIIKPKEN